MKRDPIITSKIMSKIPSKNTKPEKLLGKELWNIGLRYRKHYKIYGKPDFAFIGVKVVVFCDGDFWHGNNWRLRGLNSFKEELDGYKPYWKEKILRNIERDKKVNEKLKKDGWIVLRYWESDIKRAPKQIATEVHRVILERKKK